MDEKKKILIIDDEEQDRKAMAISLGREGYQDIILAAGAQEGIEKAQSLRPDIIFMDVVLAGVDGFDVCVQLKAMKELKSNIIMITGHLDAVNVKKARVSGADEIIQKTPGFKDIAEAIKNIDKGYKR